jgi:GNAT superfamily N-acetyltransferase
MSAPDGIELLAAERELGGEHRLFMDREWRSVDRALFGERVGWTSRPVVVEARAGGDLLGLASGEVVAGMVRLHDLLVAERSRDKGLGSRLVGAFCAQAAGLGAERCFLRCPATERHQRFYERLGFVLVARLPRYYHGLDFLEYMREPLV